ncbi:MAG: potassium/proton antiporter [Meiothermus sp.]|uniref:potassium/proton antiporter n=1 Tax=Meiothermus sp. TaxID=1955249 RepID=UPI0025DDA250|nr:potassium/proton antiporter [Meiothermus sp.]MCS7057800.1 potassium/proton antiporter [Meiothermus sp.]MCS7194643.1 potassium/proton antiporter [Meiothermus sp.]MCX7740832.1 potassium/proton antiporter [Meiothermus sp.]MDW8090948.1 potassium/proton antiporter [Meiothermus sp.]MDW8481842.1 potassium/proton antiporter [Meiothermus sp.]
MFLPKVELILLVAGVLLLLSVLASKLGGRLGIPGLLLFLAIGMLAGSDGPGRIWFDNYPLAQFVGTVALVFILYSGGLFTRWTAVRPILGAGLSLATLGVLLTALLTGVFAHYVLELSWLEALLLGAIVSSTDASAVFSVLRQRAIRLKKHIKPLLEFESGSNDPMAIFLTVGLTLLLTQPQMSGWQILPLFVQQMSLGLILGYGLGWGSVILLRRLRLGFDGLYAVLSIALMLLVFAIPAALGGSGFLAAYVAGIVIGNQDFPRKKALLSFHEGMSWLMEIGLFLILGLLVFPSQLPAVAVPALLLSAFLMLVARPIAVFLSLPTARLAWGEKAFIAWVGLRGAIPIVLATFPLLAGVDAAQKIFNVSFFVVLVSLLVQGTTLPWAARLFQVGEDEAARAVARLEA